MVVKCINQANFRNISTGREYNVEVESEYAFSIISNDGIERIYAKKYFEIIPEPVIEDVDEVGVVEIVEENEIELHFSDDDIRYCINSNDSILEFYEVASNCGVSSYHGINYLFENCDCNLKLFEKVILEIIELVCDRNKTAMLIFSTNDEYSDIWTVLDKIMDFGSETVENPNSDNDVKLWIKYTN